MIYKIGQKYNKGNFIPKYECDDTSVPGGTAAALELACVINKCNTVGVIGHADSKVIFLKLFNTILIIYNKIYSRHWICFMNEEIIWKMQPMIRVS